MAETRLEQGDQLAAEKKYIQALGKYQQGYELILPEIRRRAFRRPVAARIMRRPDLQKYMAKELAAEMSDNDALFLDRTVKLLCLAPDNLDVKQMLLELFTEQVAGFYNSRSKELFLIAENPTAQRGLWSRVFGPQEFDPEEQKATLSHEMAHALSDQHFDLSQLDVMTNKNEDGALAISALVEGEAMLVMLAEMSRERGSSGQQVLQMSPRAVDQMFSTMSLASLGGGRATRNAPPFFRRSLVFPYHYGMVFLCHLANRQGWDGVDRALRFPPISTEQILHPEKYLAHAKAQTVAGDGAAPVRVVMPAWQDLLPGWTQLGEDTLGEYQIRLMLHDQPDHEQAAAGWGGDRYLVLQAPLPPSESSTADAALGADDSILLWHTTWDSEEDALEFASCLTREAQSKLRISHRPAVSIQASTTGKQRLVELSGGRRPQWVQSHGRDVLTIIGRPKVDPHVDPQELLKRLALCRHTTWDYRLPPIEAP